MQNRFASLLVASLLSSAACVGGGGAPDTGGGGTAGGSGGGSAGGHAGGSGGGAGGGSAGSDGGTGNQDGGTSDGGMATTTIAAARAGNVTTPITVNAVVMALHGVPGDYSQWYVQDPAGGPNSGVSVYCDPVKPACPTIRAPPLNTLVQLTGTLSTYKSLVEFIPTAQVIVQASTTPPPPKDIAVTELAESGMSAYRGVYVRLGTNLTVDALTPNALLNTSCTKVIATDGGTNYGETADGGIYSCAALCSPPAYSGFQVNDGAGHELYIENFFYYSEHLQNSPECFAQAGAKPVSIGQVFTAMSGVLDWDAYAQAQVLYPTSDADYATAGSGGGSGGGAAGGSGGGSAGGSGGGTAGGSGGGTAGGSGGGTAGGSGGGTAGGSGGGTAGGSGGGTAGGSGGGTAGGSGGGTAGGSGGGTAGGSGGGTAGGSGGGTAGGSGGGTAGGSGGGTAGGSGGGTAGGSGGGTAGGSGGGTAGGSGGGSAGGSGGGSGGGAAGGSGGGSAGGSGGGSAGGSGGGTAGGSGGGSGGGTAGGSGGGSAGGSGGGSGSTGLVNGDFESGLTGWTTTNTVTASTVFQSGAASAQVGSTTDNKVLSSLAQTFTVPSSGGTLSFWYQGVCNNTVKYAWATATLADVTAGTSATLLPNTCTKTGAWVQVTSAALTAGHSMTITLSSEGEVYQSQYNYTLFDNVQIVSASRTRR
jgi:hypothetical protein